ncbi:MAG: response regulator [Cellvibrio sp.]|jgi:Response regulators consisting of a CheY-like receiver domain and a winged-helix DNA-binding domain
MAIRILVVDDASFIRDMVKKHLRENIPGVEVYEAVDGSRALAAIRSQKMDLILSDWEMPNMSGEELLRAVRSSDQGGKTPFVMISSRGDRNHVIKAVESGVSDYLTKPFTPEELLRKVFKQLKIIGKAPAHAGRQPSTQGIAFASVDVLTGGRAPQPASSPLNNPASSASVLTGAAKAKPTAKAGIKGKAQLRFSNNATPCACVVRELSLQALGGLMQRSDNLPTVFDQAVVDIEMGEGGDLARLNGYVHSIQAGESRPETNVVKIVIRFVDNDAEKFEVLSQYIAQM